MSETSEPLERVAECDQCHMPYVWVNPSNPDPRCLRCGTGRIVAYRQRIQSQDVGVPVKED